MSKKISIILIIALLVIICVVVLLYLLLPHNPNVKDDRAISGVAPYATIVAEVEIVSLTRGELCEDNTCNNPTSDSGIIKINKIVSVAENVGNVSLEKIKENSEMNVTFKYSSRLAKIKYVWPLLVSEEETLLGNPLEEKIAPLSDGSDVSTLLYPYLDGNYVVYKELVSGPKYEITLPGLEIGSKIRAQILIVNPEANPYLTIGEYQLI
ncbi:MAG: hypothetical protein PHV47_01645 [Candidatus Pacebacteria bacterium]|nr:hypothetical protein [Candidatus Paceibacterota bacterium]